MPDFAGLVRKLVPVAEKLTASFEADVTHMAWKSQSTTGKAEYANVSRRCIVDMRQRRITSNGEMVLSRATLTFAFAGLTLDPLDRFLLPDGKHYAVMASDGPMDPATGKPFATTVYLG